MVSSDCSRHCSDHSANSTTAHRSTHSTTAHVEFNLLKAPVANNIAGRGATAITDHAGRSRRHHLPSCGTNDADRERCVLRRTMAAEWRYGGAGSRGMYAVAPTRRGSQGMGDRGELYGSDTTPLNTLSRWDWAQGGTLGPGHDP